MSDLQSIWYLQRLKCDFSEYDFVNFNTIGDSGTVTATVLVSPSLNFLGLTEPISIAVQMDDQEPQDVAFIPPAPPGTLPDAWGGNDGFAANSIVPVVTNWVANPGTHTLTVKYRVFLPVMALTCSA